MKRISLLLAFIPLMLLARAQQVVATSGTHFEDNNQSLTFTVGETVIETQSNETTVITPGFNQTLLTLTSIWEKTVNTLDVVVFPNPTSESIKVTNKVLTQGDFQYSIKDVEGKILITGRLESNETIINLSNLDPAAYFLEVFLQKELSKSVKIIKQ